MPKEGFAGLMSANAYFWHDNDKEPWHGSLVERPLSKKCIIKGLTVNVKGR